MIKIDNKSMKVWKFLSRVYSKSELFNELFFQVFLRILSTCINNSGIPLPIIIFHNCLQFLLFLLCWRFLRTFWFTTSKKSPVLTFCFYFNCLILFFYKFFSIIFEFFTFIFLKLSILVFWHSKILSKTKKLTFATFVFFFSPHIDL